jgi:hypothetical protein
MVSFHLVGFRHYTLLEDVVSFRDVCLLDYWSHEDGWFSQ